MNLIDDPKYRQMHDNLASLKSRQASLSDTVNTLQCRINDHNRRLGSALVVGANGVPTTPLAADADNDLAQAKSDLAEVEAAIAQQAEALRLERSPASRRICQQILPEYQSLLIAEKAAVERLKETTAALDAFRTDHDVDIVHPINAVSIDHTIFGQHESRLVKLHEHLTAAIAANAAHIPAPEVKPEPRRRLVAAR